MLITENTTLNGIISEDIVIKNSSLVKASGIINGSISVEENSIFNLNGILDGNLNVSESSKSIIHGTFTGTLTNNGCTEIFGVLKESHIIGNNIIIHKDSVINGKHYLSDEQL